MHLSRRGRRASTVAMCMIMMGGPLVGLFTGPVEADPPLTPEAASPGSLIFPEGGGDQYTNFSLERNAHIRNATLHLSGDTVPRDVANRLNATTVAAGRANAWYGTLASGVPVGPIEAYIAASFNATQVTNASAMDGALAQSPADPANYSYQMFVFQVSALDLIGLRPSWSGYALENGGPTWTGGAFLYNFTNASWELFGTYPGAATGVQTLNASRSAPANFIRPGTGSVAIMITSGVAQSVVATDFVEVTTVVGVYPRPAVDIGDDGSYDWRFDGPGWGAMGRQTEFENGSTEAGWDFPSSGGSAQLPLLLPGGATIQGATLNLRPVAASNSTTLTGGPVVAGSGSWIGLPMGGLPNRSVGQTGFANLRNVTVLNSTTDQNAGSQTGEIRSGSDPNGYRRAAQAFNVTLSAPLASVSVFLVQVQGNPGPLVLTLESLNGTGFPSGISNASFQVSQASLSPNSWVSFPVGNLSLFQGQSLALVFSMPLAPPDTISNYVTLGTTAGDAFSGGEALSYINLTGVGESWSKVAGTDLLFMLGQDLPVSSTQALNIHVDGSSGSFSQAGNISNISFAIPTPLLLNGTHSFNVTNSNSRSIRFDWAIQILYSLFPGHFELRLQGQAGPLFVSDNRTSGAEVEFRAPLQTQLASPFNITPGPAGVTFSQITLLLSSDTLGRVEISSLDIRYTYAFGAESLGPALDALLWSLPNDSPRRDLSMRIYSAGASALNIASLDVLYDRPPQFFGFPSNMSDEDVPLLFDLNSVFHDDFDNANLSFTFLVTSGATVADVALRNGYNLSITPLANMCGDIVVNVIARDSMSLTNASGDVTFTFLPVNDPPSLTTARLNVTWGEVFQLDLTPWMTDADSPLSAASIASVGTAPVSFNGRVLIFNLSAGSADFALNVTLTDGDAQGTYEVLVHPRASDTVPMINPLPPLVVPNTAAWRVNLSLYFSDVEDTMANLTFDLQVTAGNASSFLWVVEADAAGTWLKIIPRAGATGAITAQLQVRDRDGNANSTTLGFQLVPPPNQSPHIVALQPSVALSDDSYPIYLVTKFTDAEDGDSPQRMRWTISAQDGGLFEWSYNSTNQVLELRPKPGAHGRGTISLTLTDSGGLSDTAQIQVTVASSAPAPGALTSGSAAAVLILFIAAVVFLSAILMRRDADRALKKGAPKKRKPAKRAAPEVPLEDMKEESPATAAEPGKDDMADFLRGLEAGPSPAAEAPTPPSESSLEEEEGTVALGVKSGLDADAAPQADEALPAVAASGHRAGPARLKELYLFSLRDGTLLNQVSAKELRALTQEEENEFLQWAFDQVRTRHKGARSVEVLDWREWKVVVGRGAAFFVAGRMTGEGAEAMSRAILPIIEEVDHNFPGTALDWQRTDVLDTVAEVLGRLVK